jgi:type I site-specific restriction endonuclease
MPSEAEARISINKLPEETGWRFLPDADGNRENIVLDHRVSGGTFSPNADLGDDFERVPEGLVDYLLLNTDGRAVAVVEAKRESINRLAANDQARAYAVSLNANHIFLSNDLRARDPNFHAALSALPPEEREALVGYLKTEVSLKRL